MRAIGWSFGATLGLLLIIATSLAVTGLGPSPVRAAGGEIRVLEIGQQVNYPSGVVVTVDVESESEVAEVRVYYRTVGARRWGYAYAEFQPGARVVATRSIPVRESTYIAPGADVEYYFEIRDVQGNVLRTDSTVVEYLDQRFDWKRVGIGPLQLVYHDIRDNRIEDVAPVIQEDLRRVEDLLQLEHTVGFKGVIYNSYADANAAFPVQSQTTTDHGTFAGYAFPEQGVFVGQGLDRRIIVHESAHLMLRQALDNKNVEMPDWLNEGFATYMEPGVRVRSSSELYQRTPHLKAMKSLSGTPETIPLFYQKSVSVVAHLIERYGEDRFRLLIGEIAGSNSIDRALLNVYGFDDHGLDNSWAGLPIPAPVGAEAAAALTSDPGQVADEPQPARDTVSETAQIAGYTEDRESEVQTGPNTATPQDSRQSAGNAGQTATTEQARSSQQREGPSPFVFFDVWMLAGVAAVAAVVLSARSIYSRLFRRNDASSDTREEWPPPNSDID